MKPDRPAFSLVELIMVILVMGIVTAVVLPQLEPTIADQLASAAYVVAADLDYARSLAVANNSEYRVRFVMAENRFTLSHMGTNTLLDALPDTPFRDPSEAPDSQTTWLDELPATGVRPRLLGVIHGGATESGQADVEFLPLGGTRSSQAVNIILAAGMSTSARFIPVIVHPVTGLAEVGELSAQRPVP